MEIINTLPRIPVSEDDIFNLYTRYYYDVRGNQIAVVDTNWNLTRTYYDLGGSSDRSGTESGV